ncbi:MAG: ExeM/NucH family extracellular endonuclease [Lysobacterales bacterium]
MKNLFVSLLFTLNCLHLAAANTPIPGVAGSAFSVADSSDKGGLAISLIHEVQGAMSSSPLNGEGVLVEAIVVGDFQTGDADTGRELGGFYVQEEDSDADADTTTSEGVFVFEGGAFITDVQVGDLVRVAGTMTEVDGETRIGSVTSISIVSQGNGLPTASEIVLIPDGPTTLSQSGRLQPDLEAFEGMRVTFTDTLTISEMFQLVRFNEIKLSQGGRLEQFTQSNLPDVSGFADHLQTVGSRSIVYDDGLNVQNALIGNLDGFGPTFSTDTDLRIGDTVAGLAGILSYQWAGNAASPATWRVRASRDGENTFDKANERLTTPEPVGGTLKVAGFNVFNYFSTLRDAGTTAIGANPRGASNAAEFARQTQKLVTALTAIDADVVGLVELENDFLVGANGNALDNLVAELNAVLGAGTYAWVNPGEQFIGVDAIANGLIYKPALVSVVAVDSLVFQTASGNATLATAQVLNPFVGAADQVFDNQRNRPTLAATFEDRAGQQLTVAVSHFKAKSDSNLQDLAMEAQTVLDAGTTGFSQTDIDNLLADPNYDQGDGQGFWNAARADASSELAQWLSDTTGGGYAAGAIADADFLIVGDLNAYAQEDPVAALGSQGFVDLAATRTTNPRSFMFSGQSGTLDYALASPSLSSQVTGVTLWNINADEPNALDYNTDFSRDVSIFDGALPFRASDHDPIIVGLRLTDLPPEIFADGFE